MKAIRRKLYSKNIKINNHTRENDVEIEKNDYFSS